MPSMGAGRHIECTAHVTFYSRQTCIQIWYLQTETMNSLGGVVLGAASRETAALCYKYIGVAAPVFLFVSSLEHRQAPDPVKY